MNRITLHNINEHTPQEVFNFIAGHMLTQGRRSVNKLGYPAYYGLDGLKCAVGSVIPADAYNHIFENRPFERTKWLAYCSQAHQVVLVQLQSIHDKKEPETWGYHLGLYAQMYGFEYQPDVLRAEYRELIESEKLIPA
jgi:hypothetical protein